MATEKPIGIVGAGAWGTALAIHLAQCGHKVFIWALEKDVVKSINRKHRNEAFLPGYDLMPQIEATHNLEDVAKHCQTLIITVPASANTEVATVLSNTLTDDHHVVLASKGFRETDGMLLSDVWAEVAPHVKKIAILSGPTFAHDLASGKPSACVVASTHEEVIRSVDRIFSLDDLRLYYSDDIIGVQVGAALKNVIAIAAGVSDGLDMGENMRAAIICRGLAEMMRYAEAVGGRRETVAGLSGMGDVILTASSPQSRNYRLGRSLARGLTIQEALDDVGAVVEGVQTARIVTMHGVSRGIDMAIIMAVDGIVNGDVDPATAMRMLLSRPRASEQERRPA